MLQRRLFWKSVCVHESVCLCVCADKSIFVCFAGSPDGLSCAVDREAVKCDLNILRLHLFPPPPSPPPRFPFPSLPPPSPSVSVAAALAKRQLAPPLELLRSSPYRQPALFAHILSCVQPIFAGTYCTVCMCVLVRMCVCLHTCVSDTASFFFSFFPSNRPLCHCCFCK